MIQVRVPRVRASQHPMQSKGQPKVFAEPFFCDTTQPTYPFQNFLKGLRITWVRKDVSERRINQRRKKKMQHERISKDIFIIIWKGWLSMMSDIAAMKMRISWYEKFWQPAWIETTGLKRKSEGVDNHKNCETVWVADSCSPSSEVPLWAAPQIICAICQQSQIFTDYWASAEGKHRGGAHCSLLIQILGTFGAKMINYFKWRHLGVTNSGIHCCTMVYNRRLGSKFLGFSSHLPPAPGQQYKL